MKKWLTLFIIGFIMLSGLSAQDIKKGHHIDQPYYRYMVFRMTEVLELTPEQAEKLFPLNRPYREAKYTLHMQISQLSDEVFKKNEITKEDLNQYKSEFKRLHNEEQKLDEAFIKDVEMFLMPNQVAKLIFFEPRFRRELSHELKQRYHQQVIQKKKRFWNKRK
ncbi:MAG: hypothetical protein U9O95_02280 [Candidatus Marinimicrobia bacterium]|nr:hypothetical protein [Candidatus Neomarinimicrobiota bacterium]